MRRDGERLLPNAGLTFEGGAGRFQFRGTNGRWRDVLGPDELMLYEARVAADLTPNCARWIEGGCLAAGDPYHRSEPDRDHTVAIAASFECCSL
jgi:hypothetical protein